MAEFDIIGAADEAVRWRAIRLALTEARRLFMRDVRMWRAHRQRQLDALAGPSPDFAAFGRMQRVTDLLVLSLSMRARAVRELHCCYREAGRDIPRWRGKQVQ